MTASPSANDEVSVFCVLEDEDGYSHARFTLHRLTNLSPRVSPVLLANQLVHDVWARWTVAEPRRAGLPVPRSPLLE